MDTGTEEDVKLADFGSCYWELLHGLGLLQGGGGGVHLPVSQQSVWRMEHGGRRGDGLPIQLRDLLCDNKVLFFTEEGLCGIRLASLEDITIPR